VEKDWHHRCNARTARDLTLLSAPSPVYLPPRPKRGCHATSNPLGTLLGYRPNQVIWVNDHGSGIIMDGTEPSRLRRLQRPRTLLNSSHREEGVLARNQNENSSRCITRSILTCDGVAISGWSHVHVIMSCQLSEPPDFRTKNHLQSHLGDRGQKMERIAFQSCPLKLNSASFSFGVLGRDSLYRVSTGEVGHKNIVRMHAASSPHMSFSFSTFSLTYFSHMGWSPLLKCMYPDTV
jgi:hypothetical protein